MALTTNGEASAVMRVLRYFLGITGHAGPVTPAHGLEAALDLCKSARTKLAAGLMEHEVREAFERHAAKAAAADTALDGAMYRVWIAGDWPVVTAAMNADEREAAADAVLRFDAATADVWDERLDPHPVRWWR